MKNLIITGVVGVVFFAAAFAGSTYMLQTKPVDESEQQEADPKSTDVANAASTDKADEVPFKIGTNNSPPLRKPFKPKSLTEESILKLVDAIREREATINKREKMLMDRESKMQLVLNDIQREKREYEALFKQVEAKIHVGNQLLSSIQEKKKELEAERTRIEQLKKEVEAKVGPEAASLKKNVKKISDWIAGMPAEEAAKTVKAYADDGKLNFAAAILREIEERNAAKILTALNDPILVTQLLDEIKNARVSNPQK